MATAATTTRRLARLRSHLLPSSSSSSSTRRGFSSSGLNTSITHSSSSSASSLEVVQIPALSDNYAFLIRDESTQMTACVDTPELGPIADELDRRGWKLTHILNTHWHPDHTDANEALKSAHEGCVIIGPAGEADKIPGLDRPVGEGDTVSLGNGHDATVLDVGGHTLGHIAYHFAESRVLFCGDALFVLGCGRIFEGSPEQMCESVLGKIGALPDETIVYCAHVYSQSNAAFAVTVEPSNAELWTRKAQIDALRLAHRPTVPTTIGLEKRTNPFLRVNEAEVRRELGFDAAASDAEVFAKVRAMKDSF